MIRNRNIKIHLPGLILLIFIIIGGILSLFNNDLHPRGPAKSQPVEISASLSSAMSCTGLNPDSFKKSWISNKDNFRIFSFDQTKYSENKNTDRKITLLAGNRKEFNEIHQLFAACRMTSRESKDIPVLS